MRQRAKPNFTSVKSLWVNPNFLPGTLLAELRRLAKPAGMNASDLQAFLVRCSEISHESSEFRALQPVGKIRDELLAIASESKRALSALRRLKPDALSAFNSHFDYLVFGTNPPIRLGIGSKSCGREDGSFLSTAWDILCDLEAGASYAADQCKPKRTAKPSLSSARSLIHQVAICAKRVTGKRPPYSKGTWFPLLVDRLGQHLDLPCGRALVESVIKERLPPD